MIFLILDLFLAALAVGGYVYAWRHAGRVLGPPPREEHEWGIGLTNDYQVFKIWER